MADSGAAHEDAGAAHRAVVESGHGDFEGSQAGDGGWKVCVSESAESTRPLSNVALLAALRRMGYEQGTVTVHGFRASASTLLNEQGWRPDAIERQLAHGERNLVRAAYNHAQYLQERRLMMQGWGNYLDQTLRIG